MQRSFYSDSIKNFQDTTTEGIIGKLVLASNYSDIPNQKEAWLEQIKILKNVLAHFTGSIYFEYTIPRMGKRIDVVLLIDYVIFILEFKVGENDFPSYAIDQVWDYALDLKNFHETSHDKYIAPILIATKANNLDSFIEIILQSDGILLPVKSNVESLHSVIENILNFLEGIPINPTEWELGRYSPTPTIIEAALALYNGHSVKDISRSDASAINLSETTGAISKIIEYSKKNSVKSICFVT